MKTMMLVLTSCLITGCMLVSPEIQSAWLCHRTRCDAAKNHATYYRLVQEKCATKELLGTWIYEDGFDPACRLSLFNNNSYAMLHRGDHAIETNLYTGKWLLLAPGRIQIDTRADKYGNIIDPQEFDLRNKSNEFISSTADIMLKLK